ncbi:chlorophyll a/b binding protein [Chloropicon primus]|uniref:Chlorophyll a-b binding protein, chloroplastic n=1 Tax=Chloropicon primus TaxID=1764295 RepID=A0A5B8MZX8_9CHLO|nr:chlorophyll a/b binding protein [Chloropicon primus]UPR04457.1 chlorophyll a/b binding protein [Chloropicon primus]|eukprot:QDZ25252.1 chlorophyll a/b binding protein [Chloropicon primus]
MSKMMTRSTTSMRLGGKKKATPKKSGTARQGGVGYRKFEGRPLYLPDIDPPSWLDGSMIGDRGFDPLGLAKPTEFVQMDLDQLDQNAAINKAGGAIGTITPDVDQVSGDSLSPYSEAFGIQRFRECELIHGRWCMLATLGIIVGESATGISWQNAGAEILGGAKYAGLDLPFDVTQVSYVEAILMLGVEVLRNTERDLEKRCYPGGYFDPLGFASDPEKSVNLKEAEIRHCRLAMVAMFGLGTQALLFNKGCLESLSYFGNSFNGTA